MDKTNIAIDTHSHFLPEELIEFIRKDGKKVNTEIVNIDGKDFVKHAEGFQFPLFTEFYDYETRVRDMDKMGINHALLSISPSAFYYWVDAGAAICSSEIYNDGVSKFVAEDSEHFSGMASLPMQDIDASLKELERAHEKLGLNSIQIGTSILGKALDEKRFYPIYEYCADNGILILLHPIGQYNIGESQYKVGNLPMFSKYYDINMVGNPLETVMALTSLIFGGVFERFPNLNVLASHAGGFFPYQLGRLMHCYKVRTEPKVNISKSPENYISGIYYDTITQWPPALQFLADNFGSDHIMIGTDYPFDMGDFEPLSKIGELNITEERYKNICSGNILSVLGQKRKV